MPRSGVLLWRYLTGGYVNSTPVHVGGTVYVSSQDGYAYALDANSGEMLWRHFIHADTHGAPLVERDGIIYVSTYQGFVYAFKARQ